MGNGTEDDYNFVFKGEFGSKKGGMSGKTGTEPERGLPVPGSLELHSTKKVSCRVSVGGTQGKRPWGPLPHGCRSSLKLPSVGILGQRQCLQQQRWRSDFRKNFPPVNRGSKPTAGKKKSHLSGQVSIEKGRGEVCHHRARG